MLPGLGQLYNGQIGKALRLLLGTALLLVGSVAVLLFAIGQGPGVFNRYGVAFLFLALASIVAFLIGFIAGLFLWASAVIDARRSALALSAGEDARRVSFFRL